MPKKSARKPAAKKTAAKKSAPKSAKKPKAAAAKAATKAADKTAKEKALEIRQQWEDQLRKEIVTTESALCNAALNEQDAQEQFKTAKSVHKGLVTRLSKLRAELADPNSHLHLSGEAKSDKSKAKGKGNKTDPEDRTPLPGQKTLPAPGTPDEYGRMPLAQAKATVEGKEKKLPDGVLDKLAGCAPAVLTVIDLERKMAANQLQYVEGIGQAAGDKISDWLLAYRLEHPIPQPPEPDESQNLTDKAPESGLLNTPGGSSNASAGKPLSTSPHDTDELSDPAVAAQALRELLADSDDLQKTAAPEATTYLESVTREATEMLGWIVDKDKVTEAQAVAIRNWRDGVGKWKPVAA